MDHRPWRNYVNLRMVEFKQLNFQRRCLISIQSPNDLSRRPLGIAEKGNSRKERGQWDDFKGSQRSLYIAVHLARRKILLSVHVATSFLAEKSKLGNPEYSRNLHTIFRLFLLDQKLSFTRGERENGLIDAKCREYSESREIAQEMKTERSLKYKERRWSIIFNLAPTLV
mgnify:CR=1 FL=1